MDAPKDVTEEDQAKAYFSVSPFFNDSTSSIGRLQSIRNDSRPSTLNQCKDDSGKTDSNLLYQYQMKQLDMKDAMYHSIFGDDDEEGVVKAGTISVVSRYTGFISFGTIV